MVKSHNNKLLKTGDKSHFNSLLLHDLTIGSHMTSWATSESWESPCEMGESSLVSLKIDLCVMIIFTLSDYLSTSSSQACKWKYTPHATMREEICSASIIANKPYVYKNDIKVEINKYWEDKKIKWLLQLRMKQIINTLIKSFNACNKNL